MSAYVRAAYLNRKAGRKFTMAAAGVMFEIGGIILAAAMNYEMLIIGRCFLGVAVSPLSLPIPGCSDKLLSIATLGLPHHLAENSLLCADLLCKCVSPNVQQVGA